MPGALDISERALILLLLLSLFPKFAGFFDRLIAKLPVVRCVVSRCGSFAGQISDRAQ